ncbi:hypothetical protein BGZ70_003331 [Mortierella alpina]|uniref:RING-type domain-containing protein n=1 Tax=Mortierella alpina TaxID=64518 RepID=A0A9P6ISL6_MORAP|nr:hypothetical protein BGZ70_003331 [Mortierella alpina]
MIARIRSRWENVPRNSRIVLCLTGIMTIAKVAATIAVLIVDKDADCMFLKVLLILYASRSAIGLPFIVYTHLHPRVQGAPLTTYDILLERQRTLMEIAGTCLFFLSNYFLFTQPACRQEAPALFYMTIVYVVLGYIVILVPILLCLAVILCLPLVLRVMRALDLGPVVGVKGATEEMIAAIPIVKYRKPAIVEQGGDGTVPSTTINVDVQSSVDPSLTGGAGIGHIQTTTSPTTGAAATAVVPTPTSRSSGPPISNSSSSSVPASRPKRSFFGLFQRSKKGALSGSEKSADKPSTQTAPVEYLTLEDAQDAVCAICLCDYEDEEELRKMKCSHYFHKDCVDEWLRLHRNCPLCKRDIEELSGLREGATSSSASSSSPRAVSAPERSILAPLVRTLSSPTRPA